MKKTIINQPVTVSAFTFDGQSEPQPRRIEFEGRTLTFINSGIRYLIKHNGHVSRLFDMSDGQAEYRLRLRDNTWTLDAIMYP